MTVTEKVNFDYPNSKNRRIPAFSNVELFLHRHGFEFKVTHSNSLQFPQTVSVIHRLGFASRQISLVAGESFSLTV